MKAKDYPKFLALAKHHQEQLNEEYRNTNAKLDQVIMKETYHQFLWRNSPVAQTHTWDFYLDEIDFS